MRDTIPPALTRTLLSWLQAFYGRQLSDLLADAPLWVSPRPMARVASAYRHGRSSRSVRAGWGRARHMFMRHSFARALENACAKVSEIQARLGHESLATTGRYLVALRADENPHADAPAALFGLGAE